MLERCYVAGSGNGAETHATWIEPVPDESAFLPLRLHANRRISGGFTVEENLGRSLPRP